MAPSSQVEYWNDPTVAADLQAGSEGVSNFAKDLERQLPRHSRLVELGCGVGDDAAYMAARQHSVIAIDVSKPVLNVAAQRFANIDNLEFRHADISRPLDVGGESADAVYSRLSLHYFDYATTERIFAEVFWVLRSEGRFFFICKSVDDPLYGKGTELAPDIYELNGHVRHFFSREYALELMEDIGFANISINTGVEKFYGQPSGYVLCRGTKP